MSNLQSKINNLTAIVEQLTKDNNELSAENTQLKEHLSAALDGTGLCIWEQHVPSGKLKILNQSFGTMCGYTPNELEATVDSWKKNLHPDDKSKVLDALNSHLAGKSAYYHATHRMVHKDGKDIWVSDRGRVVEFDLSGNPLKMVGTHIDITQEKLYQLELAKHANVDHLTNLLNRKALQNNFENYTESKNYNGGTLFFIDLDDFKSINDRYGHNVGDSLLKHVAEILSNSTPEDSLTSRFGDDEFAILCKGTDKSGIEKLAQRLLKVLSTPLVINNTNITIHVSIGIFIFNQKYLDFTAIYEQADKAMYSVKRKDKNNYHFG